MSSSNNNDEETTVQELVIIRRRGGGEDHAHHGGVWKIAYADFMTAMMAFFLVMWLINATDKKVLTQVATYFNPLRLTDKTPSSKGLHDSDTGASGTENEPGEFSSEGRQVQILEGRTAAEDPGGRPLQGSLRFAGETRRAGHRQRAQDSGEVDLRRGQER